MTREEYSIITDRILEQIELEKEYCKNYVRNNPGDRINRERQRDMIIDGMIRVLHALHVEVNQYHKIIIE